MKIKSYSYLSWSIFSQYSGRKQAGFIHVFINVKTFEVFPIPLNMEHVDFAAKMLKISKKDIRNNPTLCAYLIPSMIQILADQVVAVLTGVCGLEIGYRVRHRLIDINNSHARLWEFITDGEIPLGKSIENRIIDKYAIKE